MLLDNNITETANKAVLEWFAYQNSIELGFAMQAIKEFNPKVILEIGTAFNSSIACWAEAAHPELTIGIDPLTLPKTPAQQKVFDTLKETYNLQIIPHKSEDPESHRKLKELLGDKKVDFLFIDGEHIFENVKYDFENYLQYMNNPSIIGFHDIYYSKVLDKAGTGVWRIWEELKKKYNYDEIHYHSSMGIGLIYYPRLREDMLEK